MFPITNKVKFKVKNENHNEQMYCAIEAIKQAFEHARGKFKPGIQYEMNLVLKVDDMHAKDD